ncbi:MAG TPA: spermidine/putrescine ABC transporter substrate-binding protein [Candidatus Limnocylindrales bacterium]|nr:spermidine/putrescine ABC transporter substrate-binding protein [Candidatus Limnocylindrales bacterium]
MDREQFRRHYRAFQKGHISRRRFLEITGLGTAAAVIAACAPPAAPGTGATPAPTAPPASAPSGEASAPPASLDPLADWTPPEGVDLGDTLNLTSWPNYHDQAVLDRFTELTGVRINLEVYGSNEEMLAKLQAGGTGWDVLVPTNYTFETYGSLKLLENLDLTKIPRFDASRAFDARFLEPAQYPAGSGTLLGVPKDWGTTGFVIHTGAVTQQPTSWKEFWDLTRSDHSGKVTIHDYQLTSIGNALKYFGYSFNSVDPAELADAEELLIDVKPHLLAITSDYQPVMRNGDAVMAMAWTGDAVQLNRDIPEIQYVLGKEGGEIWSDFFAVVTGAPHREAAYAFLDYMSTPKVQAQDAEFHGYPVIDAAAIDLLPEAFRANPIIYPDEASLAPLEFGAAVTLTDPNRAELWARVKSA